MKLKLPLILIALILLILVVRHARGQTIPQTQAVLYSYFQTGSVPTSTNYEELIGTMFYYAQLCASNAAVAQNYAAQAATNNFLAYADFQFNGWSNPPVMIGSNNIASIGWNLKPGAGHTVQSVAVTFINPVPTNASYYFGVNALATTNPPTWPVFSNTASGFMFGVSNAPNWQSGVSFFIK